MDFSVSGDEVGKLTVGLGFFVSIRGLVKFRHPILDFRDVPFGIFRVHDFGGVGSGCCLRASSR